jgi:hypothetical protein
MHNTDWEHLTSYKVLTKRANSRLLVKNFARTDLTHWVYTSANGVGMYSGYGSEAEMSRDKEYLTKNGVVVIDWGILKKV